jgi:phosphomannomutase
MMNKQIAFGMAGWCGVMGDDFTEENVIRVAKAFAEYLASNNSTQIQVAVGFDGRKDSKAFAGLVSRVLAENDVKVIVSSAVVPTPILSFATKQNRCTAGIMVTGGHQAPQYNGLKFKGASGGPFTARETKHVESLTTTSEIGRLEIAPSDLILVADFLPAYLSNLKTIVDFSVLRSFTENPKNVASVLIDSMGGAGQYILEDIFVDCRWRAQTLFGEPEPNFFDRSPEAISKNLDPLKYNVSVTDTAFGIATDGDAGRCGIVYDNGEWMNAQDAALAMLWHLSEQKGWSGGIVKTASLTDKVRLLADGWDAPVFDAQADFSSISELMLKEQCMFAADDRGGFAYGKRSLDKDGIMAGLLFAEMIAMSGKSIREIVEEIRRKVGDL